MSTHRTVLVIADSETSDRNYQQQLEADDQFAYEVLTKPSNPPELALPQLPPLDGILLNPVSDVDSIQLLRHLREQMGDRCPPIVVVDSNDAAQAARAFKNGAADYLVNDRITPDDLRLAMRNAIETAELRQSLQQSQEQFQTSVETMLDCFGLFSAIRDASGQITDFRIDYLNEAACANNCLPKESQMGRGLCEILPAHRTLGLFDAYCHLVETGEPLIKDSLVYDDTYGDRRLVRAFDIRATRLNDGFVASWRDITERKQLEVDLQQSLTALQQQQEKLQRLIDTAPVGIAVSSPSGEVLSMNDAMLRLYGYTRQELEQGLNWHHFVPPDRLGQARQFLDKLCQEGTLPPQETERFHASGSRIPILLSGMRWIEQAEEHVIFTMDLSQQKQAEQAVQQLNRDLTNRVRELQTLLDLVPVGIAIATDDTCRQMQNNAYLRQLLGVDPGHNISKSAPAEEQPPYRVFQNGREMSATELPMQIAARLGIEVREAEFDILLPDGTVRQLLSYATPLQDDQNQIRGVIGAFLDITERNQDAAALKASQQRYRELAEAMPQMVWTADATGAVDYWNQRWYEYTGLSEAESMGIAGGSTVHPEDRDRTLEQWGEAIAESRPFEVEYRIQHRTGTYQWFICRAIPTRDSQNQVMGWIGTITNIDALKRTEALVQQSQQQLQQQLAEIEAIYQSAPIGLNVLDPELRFVRINQCLADINGFPIEAHLGRTIRDLFPDLADTVEQLLHPILQTGEPLLNVEIQGETPAQPGVKRTWLEHFLPLKAGDQVIGISTVCEEITDRIQVEAALRQSEERFRNMADNAPVMVWVTDPLGHCTYLNRGWYDFTGQTEATGLGFGWLNAVHPEDAEASKQIFLTATQRQESFRLEYRLRHQDGEYHWALDAASPWFGHDGEFKGFIGSVIDISDRKQAEEALRCSEERYRTLFETMTEGFCVVEMIFDQHQQPVDYRFIEINPVFEQQTGLNQAAGKTVRQLLPNLEPYWFERYGRVALTGEPIRFENESDAMNRWFEVSAFRIGAPDSYRVAILFKDISERKQVEAEQQAAREAAERANRVKDEFLAVLSHELRSPLNPILGWSKLLQTRKLDDTKTTAALVTIERNARIQAQLIDDLLDVAKILRGKLSLTKITVNLHSVIEAAIETVRTTAVVKGISLQATLPAIGQVLGDPARLQQIIWNLLSNAIKFTPQSGRVEIDLRRLGNQAEIIVRDTGKGIRQEFLPHLFESFRQEDASITRKYGGLGLGLAIVRQLVADHGGTITADSPGEGLGSTFTVRLPLLDVAPQLPPLELQSPEVLDLIGLRILTIDDDPDAREFLTVLLSQYGAEVLTVETAAELLAQLPSFQPDVIVSDIGMPEIDGYTLLQQVRSLPADQGGQTPAIALTAYARASDYQRALSSGFQWHVTKPLDPEQLVTAVLALTASGRRPDTLDE